MVLFFSLAGDYTERPVAAMNEAVLRRLPMVPYSWLGLMMVLMTMMMMLDVSVTGQIGAVCWLVMMMMMMMMMDISMMGQV